MNNKLKEIFRGKVVNKAHTINTGVDEFPRYVLEYLIDNYCAEETFHEDMEKVVRRLKDSFVYGGEEPTTDVQKNDVFGILPERSDLTAKMLIFMVDFEWNNYCNYSA
jgi:predicted ATP-dependent Lon-type protease